MILRVTGVPPSLNKVLRMHWTKRSQLLSMWVWMVRTAFGKPALTSEKMRVKITLHHSRFYDKDNAYGACKVIFDALKAEGHIVDDSPSWLESTVEQVKCKRIEANTTIELEPSGGLTVATSKICNTCKVSKPIEMFSVDSRKSDGRRARCRPCGAIVTRKYYQNHKEKCKKWALDHAHRYAKTRKIKLRGSRKQSARDALRYSVRQGYIIKPERCQGCGSPKLPSQIHGHHSDYSKPLEVRWLCAPCHFLEHRRYS